LLDLLSVLCAHRFGAAVWREICCDEQSTAAYSFGASRWQVRATSILPSALPEILTAMRIGIGFGWTTLVAAELAPPNQGCGYQCVSASQIPATAVGIMGSCHRVIALVPLIVSMG